MNEWYINNKSKIKLYGITTGVIVLVIILVVLMFAKTEQDVTITIKEMKIPLSLQTNARIKTIYKKNKEEIKDGDKLFYYSIENALDIGTKDFEYIFTNEYLKDRKMQIEYLKRYSAASEITKDVTFGYVLQIGKEEKIYEALLTELEIKTFNDNLEKLDKMNSGKTITKIGESGIPIIENKQAKRKIFISIKAKDLSAEKHIKIGTKKVRLIKKILKRK